MKTKTIKLSDIVIDAGTQQREKINDEIVAEYSEAMKCGFKLPPITTFFNGAQYFLVDGFHRYWASKLLEITDVDSEIHEGTKREAILYSAGVNGAHGIRPTNADKRKAVLILLNDEEWANWSDNQIAKHCKVTQPFVSKIRKEVITVITHTQSNGNENEMATVATSALEPALNRDDDKKLSTGNEENNEEFKDLESARNELYSDVDPQEEIAKAHKEIDQLNSIIESDDKLAAAMAEIKRLNALIDVIESQKRGFQSSENAAKQAAKMWKNKFEKLEKQMKASGLVEF